MVKSFEPFVLEKPGSSHHADLTSYMFNMEIDGVQHGDRWKQKTKFSTTPVFHSHTNAFPFYIFNDLQIYNFITSEDVLTNKRFVRLMLLWL